MKPAVQLDVPADLDTAPYCTILCSSDSDCNGQTRDANNPSDKRCKKGYVCAATFGKGQTIDGGEQSLCCAKICLCKDFFSPNYGPGMPNECRAGAAQTCS